jgi:hypothetical protein
MKIKIVAALSLVVSVCSWTPLTHAQDGAAPAPVEAFYCSFRDGKDMKDLMKAADRFSEWSRTNQPGYSAWILTPRFGQLGELPEVLWLGSSQSGDAFGKGLDAYVAGGGDIQGDFDKVVDCHAHVLASSVEVAAPDGPPGDGVVMFSQCSIEDDSDWSEALAAHRQYAADLRGLGASNSNWMFFPMLGGEADRDFDYWGVSTFNSWSDYFAAYEIYVNGGGWQKGMEAMNGVASCAQGTPTVWGVTQVRQGER